MILLVERTSLIFSPGPWAHLASSWFSAGFGGIGGWANNSPSANNKAAADDHQARKNSPPALGMKAFTAMNAAKEQEVGIVSAGLAGQSFDLPKIDSHQAFPGLSGSINLLVTESTYL